MAFVTPGAAPDVFTWLAVNATWVQVVLGWIPLVFSILFFIIPLVRWFQIRSLQQRRQEQNVRKRLFKAIFVRRGQPQTVAAVTAAVNRGSGEAALAPLRLNPPSNNLPWICRVMWRYRR
jgi:hypothetical protein